MNLTVSKDGVGVTELQFDRGPIRIGREIGSEVFIPDTSVSRKHAVIYNNDEGDWILEDLHSSNGTKVNGNQVWKTTLKSGDVIQICGFDLQLMIAENKQRKQSMHLEDTIVNADNPELDVSDSVEIRSRDIITRDMHSDGNPMLRINNDRFRKLRSHLSDILMMEKPADLMEYLVQTVLRDFHACHCWCGIMNSDATIVLESIGRNRDTTQVRFEDIMLNNHIIYSAKQKEHILVPRMLRSDRRANLRSALIVSFVLEDGRIFTVYIDNTCEHEHYTINDLDYLIMFTDQLVAQMDALIKKGA
ncbi:MAG: FHA domain-containing protein [Phycisphaerae bacterium]|jgi:pSer/pThr/pTyr-binding forkhead associated (FHA) protein